MRKALAGLMLAATAGLAAGCSSSGNKVVDHPSGSSTAAHVGDTLALTTANGRSFQVTVTKIVDPAQGSGSSAAKGRRYIAVELQIENTSSHQLSGNGNADANLIGANGTSYVPAHVTLKDCGSAGPQYQVAPGKSTTSCIAFDVKKAVHVAKVQFYPAAGFASDYGQWLVP